jgi:predicted enzyme related to lactoylglutathione lyase
MEKVTGIGGIFFKANDKAKLAAWYREHLGVDVQSWGGAVFRWPDGAEPDGGKTVWSPFAADTKYFEPSNATFMINFRVKKLDAMLEQLRSAGVTVDAKVTDEFNGRFGWAMDPEGNRIELWEPK